MKDTAPQRATILVVDPDGARRARLLRDLGAEAECLSAETGAAALKECQDSFVEVAVVACGRDAPEGIALLDEMAVHWPETVRIAIAEDGTAGLPDDLYQVCDGRLPAEGMRRMLRNAVQLFRVRRENDRMSFEMRFMARKPGAGPEPDAPVHDEGLGFETILRSPASPMAATVAEARHLASFDIPILISGPFGSGKGRWRRRSTARPCARTGPTCRSTSPVFRRRRCGSSFAVLRNNGSSRAWAASPVPAGARCSSAGIDTLGARRCRCGCRISCAPKASRPRARPTPSGWTCA
jgi:hypothetical protein